MNNTSRQINTGAIAGFVVACSVGAMTPASASGFERLLESAQGGRFTVLLGAQVAGPNDPVTVCLFDGAADGTSKAFDIRATAAPRYWTYHEGPPACARVNDMRHELSFFSLTESGETREVLRAPIDLGGLAGRQVNIVWSNTKP